MGVVLIFEPDVLNVRDGLSETRISRFRKDAEESIMGGFMAGWLGVLSARPLIGR